MKNSSRQSWPPRDEGFSAGQKVALTLMIVLIVCVFGVLGFMLMGNNLQVPKQTSPTAIPFMTLTRPPTSTLPPLMTATPIPGWNRFAGGGGEIWLPGSYQGGDAQSEKDLIFEKLSNAGADNSNFDQFSQDLDNMGAVIYAFDDSGAAVFFTEMYVIKKDVGSASLNAVVDSYVNDIQVSQPYHVVAREEVYVNVYTTERVMLDRRDSVSGSAYSTYGTRVVYFIKVNTTIWIVQFITDRDQVNGRLANFDKSIESFAVIP